MSLKKCYELINTEGKKIIFREDSKALIVKFSYNEFSSIDIFLNNDEIEELLKAIDVLRPSRDSK